MELGVLTPVERARLERHKRRLRAADRGEMPEWPDEDIRAAQLANQKDAKQRMRAFDRLGKAKREVRRAICIDRIADQAVTLKIRSFDAAEAFFRNWLENVAK